MPDPTSPTAADLVANLRAYGLSVSEIASELGRSPRMVRKIVRGESSGQLYIGALTELVQSGQTRSRPPRRRGRDGQLMRVRAPRGSEESTRRPQEPDAGTSADGGGEGDGAPRSGRSGRGRTGGPAAPTGFTDSTTYLPGGVRQHQVTAPRSEGTGRERARQRLLETLRRAARGQRAGRKKVKFRVSLKDGTTVDVGSKSGYDVSKALARSRAEGDDPLGWLAGEIADRQYLQRLFAREGIVIVGVEATVY